VGRLIRHSWVVVLAGVLLGVATAWHAQRWLVVLGVGAGGGALLALAWRRTLGVFLALPGGLTAVALLVDDRSALVGGPTCLTDGQTVWLALVAAMALLPACLHARRLWRFDWLATCVLLAVTLALALQTRVALRREFWSHDAWEARRERAMLTDPNLEAGRRDAHADVARGVYRLHTLGYTVRMLNHAFHHSMDSYDRRLAAAGIGWVDHGCLATLERAAYVHGYNEVARAGIEARFGPGFLERRAGEQ
jgi:hypothetical protein